MRVSLLVCAIVGLLPARASAEWQIRPFVGLTFGGGTTLIDLDHAAGSPKVAIGINGMLLGEVLGIEADIGHTPRYFQSGDPQLVVVSDSTTYATQLVVTSAATTYTANLVIAVPRRLTEYSLRPYVVVGGGFMRAHLDGDQGIVKWESTLPAMDVGVGVTGFLNSHIGVSWDVRHFRSLDGKSDGRGISIGAEQLSFWRANMALAIRLGSKSSR